MSPTLAPRRWSSSSDGDRSAADLVQVVVGLQPGDVLAVAAAVDRDRDVVAVDRGAVDRGQLAELLAQPVDLRVDLFVARLGPRDLDAKVPVATDGDHRAHLDDGVERHRTFVLARGDLDLRRGDHVDVVLAHRLRVVGGKRLSQRLFAADVLAELRLEHAARRLARPEAGKAHLPGDPAEGGVEIALELRFVDLDGDLDPVPLEGLDDSLHRGVSVPAAPRRSRTMLSTLAWSVGCPELSGE